MTEESKNIQALKSMATRLEHLAAKLKAKDSSDQGEVSFYLNLEAARIRCIAEGYEKKIPIKVLIR